MKLTITLQKEVENVEQGEQLYELVKQRFADHPKVKVTGHVSNHFIESEEPE